MIKEVLMIMKKHCSQCLQQNAKGKTSCVYTAGDWNVQTIHSAIPPSDMYKDLESGNPPSIVHISCFLERIFQVISSTWMDQ